MAVAVGGEHSAMLTRRMFAIHEVKPDYGGTVEFLFTVRGKRTAWLAERRSRDLLDIIGPLGQPFPLPRDPSTASSSAAAPAVSRCSRSPTRCGGAAAAWTSSWAGPPPHGCSTR